MEVEEGVARASIERAPEGRNKTGEVGGKSQSETQQCSRQVKFSKGGGLLALAG